MGLVVIELAYTQYDLLVGKLLHTGRPQWSPAGLSRDLHTFRCWVLR
jgi:hypothetical protein